MRLIFARITAVFLVPALMADPSFTAALGNPLSHRGRGPAHGGEGIVFASQALSPVPEAIQHARPMSEAPAAVDRLAASELQPATPPRDISKLGLTPGETMNPLTQQAREVFEYERTDPQYSPVQSLIRYDDRDVAATAAAWQVGLTLAPVPGLYVGLPGVGAAIPLLDSENRWTGEFDAATWAAKINSMLKNAFGPDAPQIHSDQMIAVNSVDEFSEDVSGKGQAFRYLGRFVFVGDILKDPDLSEWLLVHESMHTLYPGFQDNESINEAATELMAEKVRGKPTPAVSPYTKRLKLLKWIFRADRSGQLEAKLLEAYRTGDVIQLRNYIVSAFGGPALFNVLMHLDLFEFFGGLVEGYLPAEILQRNPAELDHLPFFKFLSLAVEFTASYNRWISEHQSDGSMMPNSFVTGSWVLQEAMNSLRNPELRYRLMHKRGPMQESDFTPEMKEFEEAAAKVSSINVARPSEVSQETSAPDSLFFRIARALRIPNRIAKFIGILGLYPEIHNFTVPFATHHAQTIASLAHMGIAANIVAPFIVAAAAFLFVVVHRLLQWTEPQRYRDTFTFFDRTFWTQFFFLLPYALTAIPGIGHFFIIPAVILHVLFDLDQLTSGLPSLRESYFVNIFSQTRFGYRGNQGPMVVRYIGDEATRASVRQAIDRSRYVIHRLAPPTTLRLFDFVIDAARKSLYRANFSLVISRAASWSTGVVDGPFSRDWAEQVLEKLAHSSFILRAALPPGTKTWTDHFLDYDLDEMTRLEPAVLDRYTPRNLIYRTYFKDEWQALKGDAQKAWEPLNGFMQDAVDAVLRYSQRVSPEQQPEEHLEQTLALVEEIHQLAVQYHLVEQNGESPAPAHIHFRQPNWSESAA